MSTLHLVSHTHWDREWYLTFQQFRLKLVHMIDGLLDLLERDEAYHYFMLDGATILLDDYLHMRPEKAQLLRQHVQSGRLLVGPWHVLPDEFLVSPEATIRNLLQGDRTARQFGPKMMVGYIPDPFGHIGQMPQILRGFDIATACLRRGLSTEPSELWWQSPDGSRVLTIYMRDGYDNAAWLPIDKPERFVAEVRRLRDSLAPHTATDHVLLMQGTDHMEPSPYTTQALVYAAGRLDGDQVVHSSLPAYIAAVEDCLAHIARPGADFGESGIPLVQGELRSPQRHHLLPAVLSTRIWIKQRNHACQTLLERWVEPFSTFAGLVRAQMDLPGEYTFLRDTAPVIRQTWRLLMENHPHDSICGCSIDQVHEEMRGRFDQVDQIGAEIAQQSLNALADVVDTRPPLSDALSAVVVFNPVSGPRNDVVQTDVHLPAGVQGLRIVDQAGRTVPHAIVGIDRREIANLPLDREGLLAMVPIMQSGQVGGMALVDLGFRRERDTLQIDADMVEGGKPRLEKVQRRAAEISALLDDGTLTSFQVRVCTPARAEVQLAVLDLPGNGYRTFWVCPADAAERADLPQQSHIENEYLRVSVDPTNGTLDVTDERSGVTWYGLNRFVDGGDAGDEYNYSPPAADCFITPDGACIEAIRFSGSAASQTLEVALTLQVPVGLCEDRRARGQVTAPLRIVTRATLYPGVERVEIETEAENPAPDHRLRVHFPVPFVATHADYDGHLEVVRRHVGVPPHDANWVEQPRPEVPQRMFTDVSNGAAGLMIANRGLPEAAVLALGGAEGSEVALTLLRCVGWLSRDDLSTRQGHAGPMMATPGAQLLGNHTFHYAIVPHAGDWRLAHGQALAHNASLRAVSTGLHAGCLPPVGEFLRVEPAGLVLSAVKAAEDGDGWIARAYNTGARPLAASLTPWRRFSRVDLVNLAERQLSALPVEPDGRVCLEVGPHQVVTLRLRD